MHLYVNALHYYWWLMKSFKVEYLLINVSETKCNCYMLEMFFLIHKPMVICIVICTVLKKNFELLELSKYYNILPLRQSTNVMFLRFTGQTCCWYWGYFTDNTGISVFIKYGSKASVFESICPEKAIFSSRYQMFDERL